MIPVHNPRLSVEVKADHSCNWRCCFGCRCIRKEENDSEVTERIDKVVKTHIHIERKVDKR